LGIVTRARQILFKDEKGSISILIMGLFLLSVITLMILTDISSVYLAKRTLTQATEAAAQRGVRNLDLGKYYENRYTAVRFGLNLLGDSEIDPGIPIDCAKGRADAVDALNNWVLLDASVTRKNIHSIKIEEISCDGFELGILTSAQVKLPFTPAFLNQSQVGITSRVGIFDERKVTTNYFGLNLG
jgi:hypothetical protein